MVKLSAMRGFSIVKGEVCSEKSSLSMGAKMWLMNFMMLSLRLGGFVSCNISYVLAVARQ